MHLSYLELIVLVFISLSLGGILCYALLKPKIKSLKDTLHALDASLKGMWDTNDQWQKKYTNLENNQKLEKPLKKKPLAKHASDNAIEIKETTS